MHLIISNIVCEWSDKTKLPVAQCPSDGVIDAQLQGKVKLDRYIDPASYHNSNAMAQLPMSSINISLEFLAPRPPSSAPQNYTGAAPRFYALDRNAPLSSLPSRIIRQLPRQCQPPPPELAESSGCWLLGLFQSTCFAALPDDPRQRASVGERLGDHVVPP